MGKKINIQEFVTEAVDYNSKLGECSINRSVNRYLLEYIAYGFAKYGDNVHDFIDHVDEWIRMLVKIYPEIGFDHKTHQIKAVIDYVDQLVVVDEELIDSLRYVIDILKKYGLTVKYPTKDGMKQSTIARFFEDIEKMYPVIKDRYKGLGESAAIVSKEVIMDPRTRRLVRVTMDDPDVMRTLGMLVGDGKENKTNRKEMLMNFKFTMDMIDN